jgi:hypothetical protein
MSDITGNEDDVKRSRRTRRVRMYAGTGAVFWMIAAYVAYTQGVSNTTVVALATLAAFIAAGLIVGWFHETAGAIVMVAAAVSSAAYGFLSRWDLAFWGMMLVSVIGPLLLAAYLFDAVRRDESGRTESSSDVPAGTQPRAS